MEYEFETSVPSVDLDVLLKTNQDEVFGWFDASRVDTDMAPLQPPQYDAPVYEGLSVLPPEAWSDSLLYIKPDPDGSDTSSNMQLDQPMTRAPIKRETKRPSRRTTNTQSKKPKQSKHEVVDDKHLKRLEANKLSAQASRERKKQLKNTLEEQMADLAQENMKLATEITQLETENKVLKSEFIQLQNLIAQSPILSKFLDQQISMSLPALEHKRIQQKTEYAEQANLFAPSASTDPAAFMYLLIVLQTFSQYFNKTNAPVQMPNTPLTVM